MKIKTSKGQKIFTVFNYCLLTFLALVCLYPFWHVIMASLSDELGLMKHTGVMLKPAGFTTEAYKVVFGDKGIYYGFKNTLVLMLIRIPLDLVLTALGAYVFSRKGVLFKKPLWLLCLFTMYVSGGTIPLYLTMKEFGLIGNIWGVVLPFMISTYNMIILRTAFNSVPESLCDAARIDGAGHVRTLFSVVLPLTKASIAVITMYDAISVWNGWFWSSIVFRKKEQYTLPVVLRDMIIEDTSSGDGALLSLESVKYATIVVSVAPILIVYPFIQKYFAQGLMIGAVKE